MGFLEFLLSLILKISIGILGYIYGTYKSLRIGGFKEWNKWHDNLAKANDQYGNVLLQYSLNDFTITKEGYKAGKRKETISSYFGKNKVKATRTILGVEICNLLDAVFEDNHVVNSIDNNV